MDFVQQDQKLRQVVISTVTSNNRQHERESVECSRTSRKSIKSRSKSPQPIDIDFSNINISAGTHYRKGKDASSKQEFSDIRDVELLHPTSVFANQNRPTSDYGGARTRPVSEF